MAREFGLGYLPPPPDGRNFKYQARAMMPQIAAAAKPTPRKRPYNEGPRLDQGPTPHCVGFASRGLLQAAPIMVKPADGPDGHQIYQLAQDLDEWPGTNYDGTSVNAGCKALRQLGYIENYAWFNTIEQMVAWTNGGYGSIIVGTWWYPTMDHVDSKGFIVEPSGLATPVGGHAYRVNWFDAAKQGFLIVNSWGRDWGMFDKAGGLAGEAFMSMKLAQQLFFEEDGEVAAASEVRLKPVRL